MDKWIIFDMDSTLIDTEPLYYNAIDEFGDMMSRLDFDRAKVLKHQEETDASLVKEFGYSTDRFAESFDRTARSFLAVTLFSKQAVEDIVVKARAVAMNVFNRQAVEYPYSAHVVKYALRNGYKVGLITAGERWVQIKRFDALTMRDLFHDHWVTIKKTKEVFDDFCIKNNVDKSTSWMIGDSISSDILPAIQSGLNAIHLNTSKWGVTKVGKDQMPISVPSVENLSFVIPIITTGE